MKNMQNKGFTLVELLIVIGILAVLTAAVVVVLNPAELLKQARDSQRMTDFDSLRSAISLYIATASSPEVSAAAYITASSTTGVPFTSPTISTSTTIDSNGWVPINLSNTSGGSPLSVLPIDPTNNGTYFYAYDGDATNLTFELNTRLESTKYRGNMTSDGGDKNTCGASYNDATCFYEIGTDPGLDL